MGLRLYLLVFPVWLVNLAYVVNMAILLQIKDS